MANKGADQVWLNGVIYPVDKDFSKCSALAWKDGRIVYVGDNEGAIAHIGAGTKTENLGGRTVVPGLIDSHLHLQLYGDGFSRLQIRDAGREAILDMVRKAAAKAQKGEWILGTHGWNNEVWEDTSYPTVGELDAAAPDNPVLLLRMDGHIAWVNSCAFRAAGITDSTPSPQGGEFMHTPDGRLQGCATDNASKMIQAKIPRPEKDQRRKGLLAAQERLFERGMTCIQDAGTDMDLVNDLKELYGTGAYKIRFYGALQNPFQGGASGELLAYAGGCPELGLFDGRYTVRTVKFFADGSMGGSSAALFEDYADRPGWRGVFIQEEEEFYLQAKQAAQRGLRLMTHAIGDAAIDRTLRVYGRILQEIPRPDHRYRIEHFQLITGDSLERAKALGVLAAMQATHGPVTEDMPIRRLGYERARRSYAVGMVQRVLGKVAGGSDAPVDAPEPMDGIYASVTRLSKRGTPPGGLFPENAMTREAALRSYTIWAAEALFAEKECGSLEPGKRADLTVLDKNIMEVPAEEIPGITVLRTVVNGENVYQNPRF
jgi:predicted amidohydrolase YtcJ